MEAKIFKVKSRNGQKYWYYLDKGRGSGGREALNLYTYVKPKDVYEKQYNEQQQALIRQRQGQLLLGQQEKKLRVNFLSFYKSFVIETARPGDRHPGPTLKQFQDFCSAKGINPDSLDEDNCISFRRWLLDRFKGETPQNYFSCFKQAVKAATKAGYFTTNPAEYVKGKKNEQQGRAHLTADEFLKLINHPCPNPEVYRAALTSLYTGLAFCDVNSLEYGHINNGVITIARKKSKVAGRIPIREGLEKVLLTGTGKVFNLPTANGCNVILKQWALDAGIEKHITWHCGRHSLSISLIRKGVALSTVAGIMLHTSTAMVSKTYRQYIEQDGADAIKLLPR